MLTWVTTSSLGTLETGYISEISVSASQTSDNPKISYKLISGNLPNGLTLRHDGSIQGQLSYNSTGTYTFTVSAFDENNVEEVTQEFNLQSIQNTSTQYTSIYFKPLMRVEKRRQFSSFINNSKIFPSNLIYRFYDRNFGVQRDIRLILDFGIERVNLEEYFYPLYENFYKKRIRLGSIKTAIARDSNNKHIYDVVYASVIDEMVNSQGISAERAIYTDYNDEIYYPGSIDNMQLQLKEITLQNYTTIKTNENLQPRFMLTAQENDFRFKTYIAAIPLCYTLPGKSNIIVSNIKNSGFKFNTLDFEIDRIYVSKSSDYSTDKYLLFSRKALGDLTMTDQYILGPEGWVRLDTEDDQPLLRE